MDDRIISVRQVSKAFPGVQALQDINLDIQRGEIHGLVGENGAGKSTLIKILGGIYAATSGEVYMNGAKLDLKSPLDAQEAGISIVHQELKLVDTLTVMENIYLGRWPRKAIGTVNWAELREKADALINRLGVSLDSGELVGNLTVAQKQIVEICKVLSTNAQFIVMDEPSAVLTPSEMDTLYEIIHKLKADGITILYISHRLEEIFALCDNVTVFRDGRKIDTVLTSSVNRTQLIHMMVGRELGIEYPKEKVEIGETVLCVKHLNRPGVLHDISFDLHKGEILGFAGLVGAGRTEVARAIMGADKGAAGEITLKGMPYHVTDVPTAIQKGIGLVSEDRKKEGLVLNLSVKHNLSLVNMKSVLKKGLFSEKLEENLADKYISELNIVTPSADQETVFLSGGNQQKVVIGKWLNANCDILIVDEPTRGIDVGAKKEIYSIMCSLAKQGKAIIMISSEMPELLGMCDRILVMHDGRITGGLDASEATQDKLMALAIE